MNAPWWSGEVSDNRLWATIVRILNAQNARQRSLRFLRHLYEGPDELTNNADDRLNAYKAVVDTVHAKVCGNRVRPKFTTESGEYYVKRRAENLEKFVLGTFLDADADEEMANLALDALTADLGALQVLVDEETGEVTLDRVIPGEIFVDRQDGRYGKPRTLYRVRTMDREVLAEEYPEHRSEIQSSKDGRSIFDCEEPDDNDAPRVLVVEGWHLPSSKDGKGCYQLAVSGGTLVSTAWEGDFPFIFLRWDKSRVGFYGRGIGHNIYQLQLKIDRTAENIDRAIELLGTWRVFINRASNIVKSKLSNKFGALIEFDKEPPIVQTAQAVHPEVHQYLLQLIRWAYEFPGVSQLASAGLKPAGLDSGVALRNYNDMTSERFVMFQRAYEQCHCELARKIVEGMKRAAAKNKSLQSVYRGKGYVKTIKWEDCDLDNAAYEIQVFGSSFLPSTPAAKVQSIIEMINTGTAEKLGFDTATLWRMLDLNPDESGLLELASAPQELIEHRLESNLESEDPEDYHEPIPEMNLGLAAKLTTHWIQKAILNSVPEPQINKLRTFLVQTKQLIEQAASPPEAQPPPAMVDPAMMPPPQPPPPMPPQ